MKTPLVTLEGADVEVEHALTEYRAVWRAANRAYTRDAIERLERAETTRASALERLGHMRSQPSAPALLEALEAERTRLIRRAALRSGMPPTTELRVLVGNASASPIRRTAFAAYAAFAIGTLAFAPALVAVATHGSVKSSALASTLVVATATYAFFRRPTRFDFVGYLALCLAALATWLLPSWFGR